MARENPPLAPFDHVIILVPGIAEGAAQFHAASGVKPVIGGRHRDYGTINALASAGTGYVELIALDRGVVARSAPRVIGFAVTTGDVDALADHVQAAGLTCAVTEGSRQTPEGIVLRWRSMEVIGHDFAGTMPFFIDWGETPHPSTTAPTGLTAPRLSVLHPRADTLRTLFERLGVAIAVEQGPAPMLRFEVMSPRGPLAFTGDDVGWRAALAQAAIAG
jgi:hypothetical protein